MLSISRIDVLHFNIFTNFKSRPSFQTVSYAQVKPARILFDFELYSGTSLKVVNTKANYIIKTFFEFNRISEH